MECGVSVVKHVIGKHTNVIIIDVICGKFFIRMDQINRYTSFSNIHLTVVSFFIEKTLIIMWFRSNQSYPSVFTSSDIFLSPHYLIPTSQLRCYFFVWGKEKPNSCDYFQNVIKLIDYS